MKNPARRLKPVEQVMFETHICRLDTVPAVDGYGLSKGQARADALSKAERAGHKIVVRRNILYVLE